MSEFIRNDTLREESSQGFLRALQISRVLCREKALLVLSSANDLDLHLIIRHVPFDSSKAVDLGLRKQKE